MNVWKRLITCSVAAILCMSLILGCASIMKGSKSSVAITSTPNEAKILVKTVGGVPIFEGKTPTTVKLSKKNEYVVTATVDGYQEGTAHITKEGIEGWFWGNLLCGGVLGIVIDATNGAMNKLEPDQIHIEMVRAETEGGDPAYYAVVYARDSNGELRHMAIPLIAEGSEISSN